ncbi:uncharacterized protein LOC111483984 [Cucurbita maxima]|uniref:Uncharacterized protein LOC111483984 n=1 Tax=Cucurbita maxima TaxID=3661 RepID=A0A6J1JFB3_CUCMA|nr:uncharacterized protein LOC111483984 [Cucurbita maxima]
MGGESSFLAIAPPVFDGDNYQMWAVRMKTYLEALDLWEAIEEDYEVLPLPANPTVAQIKAEYEEDERIRGMRVLNLIKDFELQKMKESKSVKEYFDRLPSIANKVRLLELLNALQAQDQRSSMSQEGVIEGVLPVNHQDNNMYKNKTIFKNESTNEDSSANYQKTKGGGFKKSYPPCRHCEKKDHPPYKCWRRPDAKCSKCNQLGHETMICKVKGQMKEVDAQVVDQEEEDQLFVVTCFSGKESRESWLIDSGSTNHMIYDKEFFEELRVTKVKRVRTGNGNTWKSREKT